MSPTSQNHRLEGRCDESNNKNLEQLFLELVAFVDIEQARALWARSLIRVGINLLKQELVDAMAEERHSSANQIEANIRGGARKCFSIHLRIGSEAN